MPVLGSGDEKRATQGGSLISIFPREILVPIHDHMVDGNSSPMYQVDDRWRTERNGKLYLRVPGDADINNGCEIISAPRIVGGSQLIVLISAVAWTLVCLAPWAIASWLVFELGIPWWRDHLEPLMSELPSMHPALFVVIAATITYLVFAAGMRRVLQYPARAFCTPQAFYQKAPGFFAGTHSHSELENVTGPSNNFLPRRIQFQTRGGEEEHTAHIARPVSFTNLLQHGRRSDGGWIRWYAPETA